MPLLPRVGLFIGCALLCTAQLGGETASPAANVEFTSLSDFATPAANWVVVGGLGGDPRREKTLTPLPGQGVIASIPSVGKKGAALTTVREHGDIEFECEFLLPVGANSGVYLMSRYEIQLFDSWGVREPKFTDCGAVYEQWDAARGKGKEGFDGVAPRANACRAPGLWQRLQIVFQAPRFDAQGKKTANARFVRVVLNGFVVQENVEVSGPTRSAAWMNEVPTGPLMIQGDHGPVALREMRWKPLEAPAHASKPVEDRRKPRPSYALEPAGAVRLQRGFVPFQPEKRLYACSVGTPEGVHYAYDFETGALLRVWRGSFLDTFEMWDGRGANQLAHPTGPALTLNTKPVIAVIEFPDSGGWPVKADPLYSSGGYTLDPDGTPVFLASFSNLRITDRFKPVMEGKGLTRTLLVEGSTAGWPAFILLAEASAISVAPGGGYLIGDREWYLDFPGDSPHQPQILTREGRQLLVVPVTKSTLGKPIVSTLVW